MPFYINKCCYALAQSGVDNIISLEPYLSGSTIYYLLLFVLLSHLGQISFSPSLSLFTYSKMR